MGSMVCFPPLVLIYTINMGDQTSVSMIWRRVWQLSTLSFYSLPFHKTKHTWRHKKNKKKQNKSALMHNYTMTLPSAAHIVLKAIYSSLHDCVALSAAENPRSSWKASV